VLARTLAQRWGRSRGYQFSYTSARPVAARENLADVRRGESWHSRQMKGGAAAPNLTSAPPHIHPTAGAGRDRRTPFLVAYNVYLALAANMPVAKAVAKAVRGSSGGLRYVKRSGLEVDGQAQFSMNLVDTERRRSIARTTWSRWKPKRSASTDVERDSCVVLSARCSRLPRDTPVAAISKPSGARA